MHKIRINLGAVKTNVFLLKQKSPMMLYDSASQPVGLEATSGVFLIVAVFY